MQDIYTSNKIGASLNIFIQMFGITFVITVDDFLNMSVSISDEAPADKVAKIPD